MKSFVIFRMTIPKGYVFPSNHNDIQGEDYVKFWENAFDKKEDLKLLNCTEIDFKPKK